MKWAQMDSPSRETRRAEPALTFGFPTRWLLPAWLWRLADSLGLDERSEQGLQHFEVSIELPASVVRESPSHFADGESQYGGANEALHLSGSVLGHSRLDERDVDGLARPTSLDGGRRALEEERKGAWVPAGRCPDIGSECRQTLRPGKHRRRHRKLGEEELGHAVEQVRLVGYVTVEGHGRDTEALGQASHGDRVEPPLVGYRQGLGEDLCPIDASRPSHHL